ncbi:hypothetical protein D3093_35640 (plasmid) [Azospirillum argentinense]|uniref:Uncharacterized protein n=1 Tax=Azospirillum argentinense TaxID=2970906 RepID=A0A4D8PRZ1_9PROT|nr:hypothetical protein [Azospirillum argentinense]QCO00577.1 hypothetical protein D3093_35640 [Azospirillum argentinense]
MPYVASKRLRWGEGFIEIGEPVPDNEPGRRYDLMVRNGEIVGAPSKANLPIGGAAIQEISNIEEGGLPPIDLEQATKRDLLTWLTKVTGKEPGPATKEETLRTRVSEILTAQAGPSSDGGPSEEQDAGGDSESPPQRLSEMASSTASTAEPNIERNGN